MTDLPPKLAEVLDNLDFLTDRADRIEALIDFSHRYRGVPPELATRPFPEELKVPACESEAYVFAEDEPAGTLRFHFAVENPQGVSAMALAAILDATLSGLPAAEIARVDPGIIYRIFGNELSMGKSMGLQSMVAMVRNYANRRLESAAS